MADPALNLVVIRSADLERAARFYAAIGIHLSPERHGPGPKHLAAVLGGTVFEVYPLGMGGGTVGARIGFRVSSLLPILEAARSAGGQVVTPARQTEWGLRAVVADPDGHRVELVEESKHYPPESSLP